MRSLGFKNPETAIDIFSKLLDPRLGGLTQGGKLTTKKVIPAFLADILKSFDPDSALINLERFISGICPDQEALALDGDPRSIQCS